MGSTTAPTLWEFGLLITLPEPIQENQQPRELLVIKQVKGTFQALKLLDYIQTVYLLFLIHSHSV